MSQIDSILGLPGLAVQRVDRKLGIHVWAKPSTRPPCVHCTSETVRIKATHSRTLKHTRQGNQIMILHLSIPKYHCTSCNLYFRHQFPWARPRLRTTESYRLEVFEAHDGGVSQKHFLNLWKQQDPVGRMNRGLLSLMRRHQWNLSQ